MAKIYRFPLKNVAEMNMKDLFTQEEVAHYMKYLELGENWRREKMNHTFYEGYPFKPPCDPLRKDMTWYINERLNFGVWVINHSQHDMFENEKIIFGWSPFVRLSPIPPHEPVNLTSADLRERLVW